MCASEVNVALLFELLQTRVARVRVKEGKYPVIPSLQERQTVKEHYEKVWSVK